MLIYSFCRYSLCLSQGWGVFTRRFSESSSYLLFRHVMGPNMGSAANTKNIWQINECNNMQLEFLCSFFAEESWIYGRRHNYSSNLCEECSLKPVGSWTVWIITGTFVGVEMIIAMSCFVLFFFSFNSHLFLCSWWEWRIRNNFSPQRGRGKPLSCLHILFAHTVHDSGCHFIFIKHQSAIKTRSNS